jgi:ribosomal protein L29
MDVAVASGFPPSEIRSLSVEELEMLIETLKRRAGHA